MLSAASAIRTTESFSAYSAFVSRPSSPLHDAATTTSKRSATRLTSGKGTPGQRPALSGPCPGFGLVLVDLDVALGQRPAPRSARVHRQRVDVVRGRLAAVDDLEDELDGLAVVR